jgi:hypothetical protein
VAEIATLARARRNGGRPFDIAAGHASWQRLKDPGRERAYIASLAAAGATWWSQYIEPDTEKAMRGIIEEGPLRIE